MILHGADPEVDAFMRQWHDNSVGYVTAHTSGSTGKPKEIRLLKSDMLHSAKATDAYFQINDSSVMLMPLSASYIAGKMMLVRAIVADCELYIEKASLSPVSSDGLPELDLVPVVPAQIPHLLANRHLAAKVRNFIIGGGAVPAASERALLDAGFHAFATYGMTETCSHVALRPLGCEAFEAMPGVTFSVDSDSCLTISSAGYSWGRLQTNDVVSLFDSRHFIWRGRRDFVINSGGVKLYPEEIEKSLSRHFQAIFYITSTPDVRWGEAVTLVYEKMSTVLADGDVMNLCRSVLSRYQVPKRIVAVDAIGRTASGKLIRIPGGEL